MLKQRNLNGGNDEFFTKPAVADYVVQKTFDLLKPRAGTVFVEPAAGNGAFIKPLKKRTRHIIAFDINPQTTARKRDFLTVNFAQEKIKNAVFIGNPPFGFASNLAIKFFNKAAEQATHIVFILPRTFRKESVQKKLNLNFHLRHEENLPKRSFLVDGKEHDVPCLFQIWEKSKTQRQHRELKNVFLEYTTPENAKFVIRRVGGSTGKVFEVFTDTDYTKYSVQSNYFCRPMRNDVIQKLRRADFSKIINSTAGVRSLSKYEILLALHNSDDCPSARG